MSICQKPYSFKLKLTLHWNCLSEVNCEAVAPAIGQAIMKAHSLCPLACEGCYVYDAPSGDDSWREQPKVMSEATVAVFADRLAEELEMNPRNEFFITWHGGEPLLAGPQFFANAVQIINEAVPDTTVIQHTIQTAGTLLDEEFLKVFRAHSIRVGVSLDGTREANDRHRVNHAGKSTYDDAVRGIRLMTESTRYEKLFSGILAVVDLANDPVETYESLLEYDPPYLDFLWPHGNWVTPPPGLETSEERRQTPYGKWYEQVFDLWFSRDRYKLGIRTFRSMMSALNDRPSGLESIGGGDNSGLVVIETDGSYEMVDTLKSVPGRVGRTGLDVRRNTMREAAEYIAMRSRFLGASALSEDCQSCPLVTKCGGGYTPHRYSRDKMFLNRSNLLPGHSIYLCTHIWKIIQRSLF